MSGRFKKAGALVLALLFVFAACFGLPSCKKEQPEPEQITYTVTFSTSRLAYTAATPDAQTVKAGERATEPTLAEEPTAGYVVIWTKDDLAATPYDFSQPVKGDLILQAVEVLRPYKVTYYFKRGKNDPRNPTSFTKATETIYLADLILEDEEDFGYTFRHWCDRNDPNTVVSEIPQGTEGDVNLRALIEPTRYEVYYKNVVGATNPNPTTYLYGTELTLQGLTREGYRFLGFSIYMDREATPVTTLTADFVSANKDALFKGNGSGIGLWANWEAIE